MKTLKRISQFFVALTLFFGMNYADACTVMEFMNTRLAFNFPALSNDDRLKVADMVVEARKWPDVEIGANVTAGAYVREKNIDALKDARASDIKAYLVRIGVPEKNISIDKLTFSEAMAHDGKGELDLHQVAIQLVPICNGGCERLCNDPGVTPTSKAIK
jgi:hypothetical protein